jgi:hypothetical protein
MLSDKSKKHNYTPAMCTTCKYDICRWKKVEGKTESWKQFALLDDGITGFC